MFCKNLILVFVLSFLVTACTDRRDELGSTGNPIKIALVPGQDPKILESNGAELKKYLEANTEWKFNVTVPVNFIAVVESFGSKRADVAIINPFGYILASQKYKAHASLIGVANGHIEYRGQIITRKGHLKSIKDINGKKFAFVDPASTSGYLMAAALFKKEGIKPSEYIFSGRHDTVIMAVYQKQVDAGATFYSYSEGDQPQDARKLVKDQYPDVFEKIEVLQLTDSIPNDPVAFRDGLDPKIEAKIISLLKTYIKTPEGAKVMYDLYHMTDLQDATDKNYDSLRETIKSLGRSPTDFIK